MFEVSLDGDGGLDVGIESTLSVSCEILTA